MNAGAILQTGICNGRRHIYHPVYTPYDLLDNILQLLRPFKSPFPQSCSVFSFDKNLPGSIYHDLCYISVI